MSEEKKDQNFDDFEEYQDEIPSEKFDESEETKPFEETTYDTTPTEFGTDTEIIEDIDEEKKKKRKKIILIVVFAVILPILLIAGGLIFFGLLVAGLLDNCITNCGVTCCQNCANNCNDSCAQSCDNACNDCCSNACNSACEQSCSNCTCQCNSSSTITVKESITNQLNLLKWYFNYILGIFR